jgi:glycosyltransferase involved in cell wall biosynthesis
MTIMIRASILIIHPEGNINNNPNLFGIVEILCEHGYEVDIVSPKLRIPQIAPCNGSKIFFYNRILKRIELEIRNMNIFNFVFDYKIKKTWNNRRYNLIIGVDRDGIIEASYLSHLLNVPYGLISYEIFFRSETSKNFKKIEIDACKDIEFAVCQDSLRSSCLAKENQIDLNKIINIPVAGRGIKTEKRTHYLHTQLNIPHEKKIALFAGSIVRWSMIEELIQSVNYWPKDWVLVLHNRYGLNSKVNKLLKDINTESIFISNNSYPKPEDLNKMLQSADLGIALYKPMYTGIYDGDNLKYLGLASGKIATYLQHGIPVLTNENGLISDLIREYDAGYVIREIKEIPESIDTLNLDVCHNRCYALFDQYLDLNTHIAPLLKKIKNIT